jgi:hypothetical protein
MEAVVPGGTAPDGNETRAVPFGSATEPPSVPITPDALNGFEGLVWLGAAGGGAGGGAEGGGVGGGDGEPDCDPLVGAGAGAPDCEATTAPPLPTG